MKDRIILYWARRDFRLTDNPALHAALEASKKTGTQFLPLFILEPYMVQNDAKFQFGLPSRIFLSRALPKFAEQFTRFGVVEGKAAQYLTNLNARYQLSVYVNDDVYPDFYTQIEKLKNAGVEVEVFPDALTIPRETRTKEGKIYSVFTPFKNAVWYEFTRERTSPTSDPGRATYVSDTLLKSLPGLIRTNTPSLEAQFREGRNVLVGTTVIDLDTLIDRPDLTGWYVTESEAKKHFSQYLKKGLLDQYGTGRDSLEGDAETDDMLGGATSKMSLALAWGLVSARMLVRQIQRHTEDGLNDPFSNRAPKGAPMFVSELIWREFYRYLLHHHPHLMYTEFQERFRGGIEWVDNVEALRRFTLWIQGKTGYEIVDAAMQQIAHTGWMHNRARMIVASVLTKNLGVDWRWGQEYFRAALIDLDEASNNGGWQWGASVGADPKPIRIFNPELQAKNYDASGRYRDRWLTHNGILRAETTPIIEHKYARREALKRYGLKDVRPRDY